MEQIRKRLQWQQVGCEGVFTLATCQSLIRKLVTLHHRYQSSLKLQQLDEHELFQISSRVYVFDLERIDNQLRLIFIRVWDSNAKQPTVSFQLDLIN
ncbi:unnamed protein product, partial [Rotaria sp. Silwood2]